jgi:hypothetical protein
VELFKITCVTCSARLSVRDAALVGHILACPRCGSMVQVTAPAASAPPTPPHATPAITVPLAEASVFDVADVGASLEDARTEVAPFEPLASKGTPATTVASGGGLKLAAIILAGALAGSAVVVGALTWLGGDDAPPVAAPATRPDEKNPVAAPLAVAERSDDDADHAAAQKPVSPTDADEDQPVAPAAESTAAENATEDAAANVIAPPAAAPQAPSGAGDEAPVQAIAEQEPPADAPAPRLRIDPLEIDPEGLDLATLFRPRADEPVVESLVDAGPAAPVESEAPAAAGEAPAARQVVRRDGGVGGAPGDAAVLLARRLPGVEVEKMPLCRFLDLAGQLSGLPVSVEPAELRLASASAGAEVSVEAKDATIEEIVAAAVKPLKLAVAVENSQLILRHPAGEKRRTTACPVDDLVGGQLTAEELGGWIQELVAPESWEGGGGSGKLKVAGDALEIEQREDVTYETFMLLERWRLVRGLPTRTKYPKALLAAGAENVAMAERLGGPATFTFSQYTPLREIFRWWQEELEVAVLVDWPALAEDRLWPQTRIAASAIDKPWGEAIDSVLEPLGLGWRPAGARAIQITTLGKVRTEPVVELYRLAASSTATAAELANQVARLAAAEGDGPATQASVAVKYDAANRVLLARAPASVQRRLGEWLKGQRMLDAE